MITLTDALEDSPQIRLSLKKNNEAPSFLVENCFSSHYYLGNQRLLPKNSRVCEIL